MRSNDRAPWWEAYAWEAAAEADRRRRREGTKLIIVSSALVAVSIFCLVVIGQLIGLVGLVFFGACLLGGIIMRGDPESFRTHVLTLGVSMILGVAGGLYFVFSLITRLTVEANPTQIPVLIVSAIAFVFFGIFGLIALILSLRRRRANSTG